MPFEQRLHPVSLLFALARSLRAFALPGLIVVATRGCSGRSSGPFSAPGGWELWLMILLIPSIIAALARYLSFRLCYEETELIVRSGIIFRNERHIPYARVQNIEAVQNVAHRALGVTDVRIETGSGSEPEATISVLPFGAFEDMRRRVFAGRTAASAAADVEAVDASAPATRTLLRLTTRELLLCGFLENRGVVVVGAAYGVLWELGLVGWFWNLIGGNNLFDEGPIEQFLKSVAAGRRPAASQILGIIAGIGVLMVLIRLVSMGWALLRLYDFHLTRTGEDLRTRFGLITRIAVTIPQRRIQTVTVRQTPLYKWLGRASVRVETAGGRKGPENSPANERAVIAPVIRTEHVPALMTDLLPGFELANLPWEAIDQRAFRRAIKPRLFVAATITIGAGVPLGWWTLYLLPFTLAWATVAARIFVRHVRWTLTDDVVGIRTGWLWQRLTVARRSRIQAVTKHESPFDRRTGMARVRVDTAGATDFSHRVDVPYLARDTAMQLYTRLLRA
jgi:putative membrane protein